MIMSEKLTYEELEERIQALERAEKERQWVEKALQESENRYRGVVEDMPVLVCRFLPGGEITFVNRSYCEYFNRTMDELIGSNFLSLIPQFDQQVVLNNISALTVEAPTQSHEHSVIAPNGDIRWQRWTNRALCDARGDATEYQSIGEDITEQKWAEEALRESERRYRNIYDNAQIGLYRSRIRDGKIEMANHRMAEIFGYASPEECVEKYIAIEHYVRPELRDALLKRLQQHGKFSNFEAPIKKDDGSIIWIQFSGILSEEKGCFEGVAADITDRRQAEEALRKSEEKFRTLVEESPLGISLITSDARYQYVNPAFQKILGYTIEDIPTGREWFRKAFPDDKVRHQVIQSWMENENQPDVGLSKPVVFPVTCKDGSRKDIQFRSVKMENGDILVLYEDITERSKMERLLREAQKFEAIGTLAGGIAHDFNNLLMGIQGRASLMALELGASHIQREHIDAIQEYVQSATTLTRQLLGFARGGKYEVKTIDLNALLRDSATMFGRTRKEIQIHINCRRSPLVVEADMGQIEQVLLNMYVNAWQAMPDGGKLFLETDLVTLDETYCEPHQIPAGSYAKITIMDDGPGMDETTRQRIFDPFFSTKEKTRGTGLGLASAYGIIKHHAGLITVHSEAGHGTTFCIYLPKSDKNVPLEDASVGGPIRGSETILLVDDEEMVIEVSQAMLKRLGYTVWVANSGNQAIEQILAKGKDLDLVILDLVMPGIDGGTTFDRIREIEPKMPVLLSSGYTIDGKAHHVMSRGCNGFVQKPFNIIELSEKVRNVLDEAKRSTQT